MRMPLGLREDPLGDLGGAGRRGPEIVGAAGSLERHRDARNPQQGPLHRPRHGPRIRHVVAEVVALVDAREDQVRRRIEQPGDRDVDTVGGRAVDLEDVRLALLDTQRPPQRQRVADRAGFDIRRHDDDLAQARHGASELMQALRPDPVVVGN